MGRRYGRNQKRAHREKLEHAIQTARAVQSRCDAIVHGLRSDYALKLKTAKVDALNEFLRDKNMDEFLRLLVSELAYGMQPEMQKIVEQIMASAFHRDKFDRPLDFTAREVPTLNKPEIAIEARTPDFTAEIHTFSLNAHMRGRIFE